MCVSSFHAIQRGIVWNPSKCILGLTTKSRGFRYQKGSPISCLCHGTTRTVLRDSDLAFPSRDPPMFTEKRSYKAAVRLDTAIPKHSSARRQEVIAYMNFLPYTCSEWSSAVAIVVEKPFGGGRKAVGNATQLHQASLRQVFRKQIHLTDHWLSYTMKKHVPDVRKIAQQRLDIEFMQKFEKRGAFIDGSDQVRRIAVSPHEQTPSDLRKIVQPRLRGTFIDGFGQM